MKKIVFICTGNTCRSPMAERLLKEKLKKNNLNYEVISRGLSVIQSKANKNAIEVLKEYNIDLYNHLPTILSEIDLNDDNLILTMTNTHKQMIKMYYPHQKVYTICEYIGSEGDILDPYGGDLSVYRMCANKLNQVLNKLVEKLKERCDNIN